MLTPFDDFPIHQTPLPVAHVATGDPNHYDRWWCNGYTEDWYFGAGMAVYPNRGIIDAAFAVVHDGVQRSVFASGRMPVDRADTRIGPISIEVVEPLRSFRVRADAADLGIDADVTFTTRTVALEEPRQTITAGNKTVLDSTRLTQWGTWRGHINAGGTDIAIDRVYGTKDRSWGVRPVGPQVAGAPDLALPQVFFLWAPINWDDRCTHFLCFERGNGDRFVGSQAVLDVVGADAPLFGPEADAHVHHLAGTVYDLRWAPGLRRSQGATLRLMRHDGGTEQIELEPLLTFRMRGLGYMHPEWGHGSWHGELAVGSEEHKVEELDNVEPWNIHIQQVMRARWGDRTGLGVLEQLAFGEHTSSGLTGIIDGYQPA
ncbi:MAG TPA: hypothetical protein VFR41_12985 [Acidimicrobiia bacterium]|nr:hypothetical protein [Acidimicrobiia bacterium]